ncbi:MAG: alpha/beta fold hydrolase, partial [Desulfobacterales bacterium]
MISIRLIRKTAICTVIIGAVYMIACTYLWARQGHFIFTPRREIKKTPASVQLPYENIYISLTNALGRTERIHSWWIPNSNASGRVLLYLHGSALNIGANVNAIRRFHNLGFAVFIVSYRGYGLSDGEFPSEENLYADAEAAWNHLVLQKKIRPEKIYVYGHSIGGAVAIDLAVRHPDAAGLIAEATFTSIIDVARLNHKYRIFPLELIVHQRFDSVSKVADLRLPVLFIHGTNDHLIPVEMSRLLYARTPEPKSLKLIPGGGHNDSATVGGADYLSAITDFVATNV